MHLAYRRSQRRIRPHFIGFHSMCVVYRAPQGLMMIARHIRRRHDLHRGGCREDDRRWCGLRQRSILVYMSWGTYKIEDTGYTGARTQWSYHQYTPVQCSKVPEHKKIHHAWHVLYKKKGKLSSSSPISIGEWRQCLRQAVSAK